MSFTRDWDNTAPIDHTLISQGPTKIRNVRSDVEDRIAGIISGFVSGETVKGIIALPFIDQVTDPSAITDQIQIYGKAVAGKTELFARDEDGNVIQITSGGGLKVSARKKEIAMYGGAVADIATDWSGYQLCDGTNNTPDLRDKFIVGAKQDDSGVAKTNVTGSLTKSGSSTSATDNHTLTSGESGVPAHVHVQTCAVGGFNGGGNAQGVGPDVGNGTGSRTISANAAADAASGHSHTLTNLVPSYYALCFITKTADWA